MRMKRIWGQEEEEEVRAAAAGGAAAGGSPVMGILTARMS